MYEKPWLKPTRLRTRVKSFKRLSARCDRSHTHITLRGKVRINGSAVTLTSLASPYPRSWCVSYSKDLTDWAFAELGRRNGLQLHLRKYNLSAATDVGLLNCEHVGPSQLVLEKAKLCEYHHIDDCVLIGSADSNPKLAAEQLVSVLEDRGLKVYSIETNEEIEKFVGYTPDVRTASWLPPLKRHGLLYCAISVIMSWREVSPMILEKILGHWMWLALLNRPLMSIPHAIYRFVSKYKHSSVPKCMWRSMRPELKAMRASLALLKCTLSNSVLPIVGAADASGFNDRKDRPGMGDGFSVMAAHETVDVLVENRLATKRRVESSENPLIGKKLLGKQVYLNSTIPAHWIKQQWFDVLACTFRKYAHIDELELHGQLAYLELLAKMPDLRGTLALCLCDNKVASGVLARGRSKEFRLNKYCRRKCALEIAAQVSLYGIHVESPYQPMDTLSRNLTVCGCVAAIRNTIAGVKREIQAEAALPFPDI